jgi:hypothetical protein
MPSDAVFGFVLLPNQTGTSSARAVGERRAAATQKARIDGIVKNPHAAGRMDDDTTDLKPMPPSSNPSTTAGGGRDRWMVVAAGMSYPDSGGSQSSVMGMPCRNLNPTPRPRTTTLITRG